MIEWEAVKTNEGIITRAKVFGGWLIKTDYIFGGNQSLTFIPDTKHEWKLN